MEKRIQRDVPSGGGNPKPVRFVTGGLTSNSTLGEIYAKAERELPASFRGVTVGQLDEALSGAERDETVGVSHAFVARDEGSGIGLHVATVETAVKPHVHEKGPEDYIFLGGVGRMRLAETTVVDGKPVVNESTWKSQDVRPGMVLTVAEGYAHRLENKGPPETPVKIAFTCPDEHLGPDRFMVENPPASGN